MKLTLRIGRAFRTITPEDYLFNQREAVCARSTRTANLRPLPCANQGDIDLIDEVQLIGVTRQTEVLPADPKQSPFDEVQMLAHSGVDLMFVQVDPSDYLARQRFLSHKCAAGGVEDYRLDGVEEIDPHRPITWEETVVNLFTLDMLRSNTLPSKTSYKNGLYAYSYPFLQDTPETRNSLTPIFVDTIGRHVLGGNRTDYPLIDRFLYAGLMGRHKVMLGGMPETLYKMILGQALSIHELRDIFRTVLQRNQQLTSPLSTRAAAENFMPHIFMLPKDLYMTALLKESFQAATQIVCAVGMEHFRPIQEYWVGPPHGINYTEATRIPQGFAGETTEDLVEKQAMLDVLLETRTWSKPYLSNPFPYLFPDVSKVPAAELQRLKQLFLMHYRKYSLFRKRELPQLAEGAKVGLLEGQREEVGKAAEQLKDAPSLSHLKKKMDLKLDRGFFASFK